MNRFPHAAAFVVFTVPLAASAQDAFVEIAGASCPTADFLTCYDASCPRERIVNPGPVVELTTRRTYFLDYPCDLAPGEDVTFVLSLHGGGAPGNWHRHYFPLYGYVEQHRLVVATPNSPTFVWTDVDDAYLQNIVEHVIAEIGVDNIASFWLAGHSQGGATARRLVCTEFFRDKVDGFLSLSGGRVGGNPGRADFGFRPEPRPGSEGALTSMARILAELPDCDFSHIYTTGELEMDANGLPASSEWAAKYACGARTGPVEVVDSDGGYVYDSTRLELGNPAWGLTPGPGTALIYQYSDCAGGRIVADAVRVDKGHTEGLEPEITEALIELMLAAPGGKLRR